MTAVQELSTSQLNSYVKGRFLNIRRITLDKVNDWYNGLRRKMAVKNLTGAYFNSLLI